MCVGGGGGCTRVISGPRPNALLAKMLCDSSFLGEHFDLIHSHFNMYGFRSYLFLYII